MSTLIHIPEPINEPEPNWEGRGIPVYQFRFPKAPPTKIRRGFFIGEIE